MEAPHTESACGGKRTSRHRLSQNCHDAGERSNFHSFSRSRLRGRGPMVLGVHSLKMISREHLRLWWSGF